MALEASFINKLDRYLQKQLALSAKTHKTIEALVQKAATVEASRQARIQQLPATSGRREVHEIISQMQKAVLDQAIENVKARQLEDAPEGLGRMMSTFEDSKTFIENKIKRLGDIILKIQIDNLKGKNRSTVNLEAALKEYKGQLESVNDAHKSYVRELDEAAKIVREQSQADEFSALFDKSIIGQVVGEFKSLYETAKRLIGPLTSLGGIARLLGGIFALIMAKFISDQMKMAKLSIEAGMDWEQGKEKSIKLQKTQTELLGKGIVSTLDEVWEAAHAFSTQFTTLDISSNLIKEAVRLESLYGIQAEATAKLTEHMIRYQGVSEDAVRGQLDLIMATGKANHVAVGDVVRMMSENVDVLAKAAEGTAARDAQTLIYWQRIGSSIRNLDALADKLVSDFEGTLASTAKLQTLFPGLDTTEMLIAAQFGGIDDMSQAMTNSLRASGIDPKNLPRSFKNALSEFFGMDIKSIENMLDGNLDVKDPTEALLEEVKNETPEKFRKALSDPLKAIEGLLDGISGGVFKIFGWLTRGEKKNPAEMSKGELAEYISSGKTRLHDRNLGNVELSKRALEDQRAAGILGEDEYKREMAKLTEREKQLNSLSGTMQDYWVAPVKNLWSSIKGLFTSKTSTYKGGWSDMPKPGEWSPEFATGGIAGDPPRHRRRTMLQILRKQPGEVPAVLHQGEAVLNRGQQDFLSKLLGFKDGLGMFIQNIFGQMSGIFSGKTIPSFKNIIGNIQGIAGGVSAAIGSLFGRGGKSGPGGGILANIMGGAGGGGLGGIFGKIGGLFKGGAGGILGKVGGLFKGGLGGIAGKIGGLFGGGGLLSGIGGKLLGGLAGGPIGLLASFGMPILSKIPVIGKVFGGVSKAIGGVAKKVGGFFKGLFGKKKKPKPVTQDISSQAIQAQYLASMQAMPSYYGGYSPQVPGMYGFGGGSAPAAAPVDMRPVEAKLDSLIGLMKSGGIAVYLDGKKVSEGILSANRYG